MSMRTLLLLRPLLLGLILFALFSTVVAAEEEKVLYRYKNAAGATCFTDDLPSIPAKFRKSAVPVVQPAVGVPSALPVAAESLPAATAAPPVAPPSAAAGAVAVAQDYWDKPWVRGGAFLAAACVIFLGLLKLLEFVPSRLVGRLILLGFFLGVGIFGYKLCVEQMLQQYAVARAETQRTVEEVNQRQAVQGAEMQRQARE